MSNRLSGKVCIITGTGGGMGREAALTFARGLLRRSDKCPSRNLSLFGLSITLDQE
jgi:hypothetical protein